MWGKMAANNVGFFKPKKNGGRKGRGGNQMFFPPETETNGPSFQLDYKKRKVKPFPAAGGPIYSGWLCRVKAATQPSAKV